MKVSNFPPVVGAFEEMYRILLWVINRKQSVVKTSSAINVIISSEKYMKTMSVCHENKMQT